MLSGAVVADPAGLSTFSAFIEPRAYPHTMTTFRTAILLLAAITARPVLGQSAATVANGLFYMPTTWSCLCVPTPDMDLTIAHAVTLNNDLLITSGSITIGAGASLQQDGTPRQMLVSGGPLTNNGTFDIDVLAFTGGELVNNGNAVIRVLSSEVTITNGGSLTGVDSMLNNAVFTNTGHVEMGTLYNEGTLTSSGTLLDMDSLYNEGTLEIQFTGIVDCDSMYNEGTLVNDGTMETVAFTNEGTWENTGTITADALLNEGVFENWGSLVADASMTNRLWFINHDSASVDLFGSCLNANAALTPNAGVAIFTNNGQVTIHDSWYNYDQVVGGATGGWTVQDSTVNLGTMAGPYGFCDQTPPAAWPYVDFNSGTVGTDVLFCQTADLDDIAPGADVLWAQPVPASGNAMLFVRPDRTGTYRLVLHDVRGTSLLVLHDGLLTAGEHRFQLPLDGMAPGVYTVALRGEGTSSVLRVR